MIANMILGIALLVGLFMACVFGFIAFCVCGTVWMNLTAWVKAHFIRRSLAAR